MIQNEICFRVRYAEVDRMGYVHHGNYAAYFEMGRTELMREYGLVYKELEDAREYCYHYWNLRLNIINLLYTTNLTLITKLQESKGVRMVFELFV